MAKRPYSDNLKDIFAEGRSASDGLKDYSRHISKLLDRLDYGAISGVITCFKEARDRLNTIFFMGNGGSAATASHFAQDLAEVGRKLGLRGFKTASLCDNISSITALANDYGYEHIFASQIREAAREGDVVVAISASGNSPNVVEAVRAAKGMGCVTIGLVGFDGGKLKEMCDHAVCVATEKDEYGPVEDLHMILDHMIISYLLTSLK